MQKEFEKVAGPIRQKMEERQAALAEMDAKAAQAAAEVEAAQKEAEDALRAGNETAYGAAADRLARAQTSAGYFSGRKKLLTAEPILDDAGLAEYERKTKAVLLADEDAALAKLRKIITDIRAIHASLEASFGQAMSCRDTGRAAANKGPVTLDIWGDPRLRSFCRDASAEFARMFERG